MALKSFVCLNLMVLLSIFSSNSFLTLGNSYKHRKCIHHHLFLWVCPFCVKRRVTTPDMYLLPPLLLSPHEPQDLAKILACLIIMGLSNNIRLDAATLMLNGSFPGTESDSSWVLHNHLQQRSATRENFISIKMNRNCRISHVSF